MRRYVVLATCVLLFAATAANAGFYRWVDKDGAEFFTNDPEKVPQEYRGGVTNIHPDESRVNVGERPAPADGAKATTGVSRDKHGRGEEYWRKRASNLRLKLRDLQDEHDLVVKQIEEQDRKAASTPGKKNKKSSSLEKRKRKLENEIARTRRVLDTDLAEEARRAEAYPGWIRE
jgi:hypothetical protein